nr:keratin-associated protein 10-7-like [Cherax quadricarinatus]
MEDIVNQLDNNMDSNRIDPIFCPGAGGNYVGKRRSEDLVRRFLEGHEKLIDKSASKLAMDEFIKASDMKCCAKWDAQCANTKLCSLYDEGQCKTSCAPYERVISGICNLGSKCKCCAPPCKPLKSCTDVKGFCVQDRKDCVNGLINVGDCQGYGCLCCSLKPKCVTSYSCSVYEGGRCKINCEPHERVTSGSCYLGPNCKCCAKPCKATKSCTDLNGFCVQDRKECFTGTINISGCQGYGCFCCVPKLVHPCKQTKKCTAAHGFCCQDKRDCGTGIMHKEGCEGQDCFCCIHDNHGWD